MCNSCTLICCNMATCVKYETYLLKSLLSLQDILWLMTYSSIWQIDDLFIDLSDQLCPVHQIICSFVTTPPASLLSCDLSMHQPAWLLSWPVHQPRWAALTCPPAWLHSCYTSNNLSSQLPPVYQPAMVSCDPSTTLVTQLWHVYQCHCSVVTCQPTWVLSCDLSTNLAAQLWPVNQPLCTHGTVQQHLSAWWCTMYIDYWTITSCLSHVS